MKSVIEILMNRDGMTESEAKNEIEYVREMINDANGNYDEVEDIMYGYLGLEMDYIFDILY